MRLIGRKNSIPVRILFFISVMMCGAALSAQTYDRFQNGMLSEHMAWHDTQGRLINAHDGGIIFAGGKYHWYGLALRPAPATSGLDGGQKTDIGVVMYSSTDLYNWSYEGVVLACSPDPQSPLHGPMRFERPKIIYNDSTKQYVMWFHYVGFPGNHGTSIGSGEAGVAVSSRINGPYQFKGYSRPIDSKGVVRDFTLFEDDDGSAYFIYDRDTDAQASDPGRVLYVVKLTSDYLSFSSTSQQISNAKRREAPVMIKHNGAYFLITSAETSWKNNAANYYRADNVLGPYTVEKNPCVGPDSEVTFDSQGTYAFPVQGKTNEIIFMAERHITSRMTDSSYIFLPIRFLPDAAVKLAYYPSWRLDQWPQ